MERLVRRTRLGISTLWRLIMYKIVGKKEPNRWTLEMGLDMRAWTAEGIIKHLKEMPKNTILISAKYREQFSELTLEFEEAQNV